ncbi:hypothetical protein Tco_1568833 [Tanacetum coccineum]
MADQEQIPPQQEKPFVAAKQVGFNLEDIILNTNNEVALLYPEHNNKDHFKCVSDFISKCCLRNPFTRSPNMCDNRDFTRNSLLLTSMVCDDAYLVMPRDFALAGYGRLVSELCHREEPIEEEPLKEPKEEA